MASEIRLVINPATGNLSKVELLVPDIEKQSQAFKAYQALSDEIQAFSKKATKIIQLERAMGRLT
jgi:hypothetical protein